MTNPAEERTGEARIAALAKEAAELGLVLCHGEPVAWRYFYDDQFGKGEIWWTNNINWNGQDPKRAEPLYRPIGEPNE